MFAALASATHGPIAVIVAWRGLPDIVVYLFEAKGGARRTRAPLLQLLRRDHERQFRLCGALGCRPPSIEPDFDTEPIEISVSERGGAAVEQPPLIGPRSLARLGRDFVDRRAGEGDQIAQQLGERPPLLAGRREDRLRCGRW